MKRNRVLHLGLDLPARTAGGDAAGYVRRVGRVAGIGLLDHDHVFHRVSQCCASLDTLLILTDAIDFGYPQTTAHIGLLARLDARANARSSRGSLNRPGSRTTMMPANWRGGYRSGSEKSLSSVTRHRSSAAHFRARSASGVESRFWSATVATRTPRPSGTRRPSRRGSRQA